VERKRELSRLYTETVDVYDRRYREIQLEKYRFARHYLVPCKRMLEVGCGMGFYLGELEKLAEMVVGVDLSEGMLRRAKGILVLADAEFLPFKDEVFDQVLSITALQNFPNPLAALREMWRVMCKGGRMVLSSLRKKHPLPVLLELVRGAGFSVVEGIDEERYEDVFVVATKS
jgi:ubiquinone/menaquinone biosynthesis C-methylase UbiE